MNVKGESDMSSSIKFHLGWVTLAILMITNLLMVGMWIGATNQRLTSIEHQIDRIENSINGHMQQGAK